MQTTRPRPPVPFLGVGVDWLEAISENYMVPGGRPPRILDTIRARFPIALHDLMPLPMTASVLDHVVERVARIQDRLGRRIAVENVPSYVAFADDEMPE